MDLFAEKEIKFSFYEGTFFYGVSALNCCYCSSRRKKNTLAIGYYFLKVYIF